jgi:hypothetical protein
VEERSILVVYGYHKRETFAIEVAKRLEQLLLKNVTVKQYEGKPDKSYKEPRLRSFLLECYHNNPFSYAINLHNSDQNPDVYLKWYSEWKKNYPNERHPTINLEFLHRYGKTPNKTKMKINDYCLNFQKIIVNKYPDSTTGSSLIVTGYGGPLWPEPKEPYDRIEIEFLYPLITVNEAVDFLKGLIKVLQG